MGGALRLSLRIDSAIPISCLPTSSGKFYDLQVTNYRRNFVPGESYFFTVNLADRRSSLLIERIDSLRRAFRYARAGHPFTLDAIVVLPDHLHTIWTLPPGDLDFANRWRLIKTEFSRALKPNQPASPSRSAKGERDIWQRRYWEHTLRDEIDFQRHCDYIHFNPVKHGVAMSWRWFAIVLLGGWLSVAGSLASGAEAKRNNPSTSLCRAAEQTIFSCSVTGSPKFFSLCGSRSLDARRGYLQYRFGKPGAVELQFPRDRANAQRVFRYAHYFRAQVDRTEVTFDNEGYRYVVFDYYEGDIKPAVRESGVRVRRHGATTKETELTCDGKPTSKLGSLESIVPRDNDNPLNQ